MLSFTDYEDILNINVDDVTNNEYGECCGQSMHLGLQGEYLICDVCDKVTQYNPYYDESSISQQTQYDTTGKIIYGKSIEKTHEQRILSIAVEFYQKIRNTCGKILPMTVIVESARLFYLISTNNKKKKDNRNQLFAACFMLTSVNDGYIISEKDLVNMLGLRVDGISTGLGIIRKYKVAHKLDIKLDEYRHRSILSRYYRLIESSNIAKINTIENIKFGVALVDFMLENSIAYNTQITTKCAGVTYYIMAKYKLHQNTKKSISNVIEIGQDTMIKVYHILSSLPCQAILPPELKL